MADDNKHDENTLRIVAATLAAPQIANFDFEDPDFPQSAIRAYRIMFQALVLEEIKAAEQREDAGLETWKKLSEQL